ncbi:DUF6883 domain-containing protein [Dyadobacter sp. CY323]|uniref:DUF6883 domain-containing protein n=1 Tax=Dyadobacter sp. CY323 TaxID=2907302 RepID=UPI0038D508D7
MPLLRNCSHALVSLSKIEKYLLKPESSRRPVQSKIFIKFGYSVRNSISLQTALIKVACEGKVVKQEYRPPFGTRVTMIGKCESPDKRNPKVLIGWFFDMNDDQNIPRLITVIP